jgi:hypothetical protein
MTCEDVSVLKELLASSSSNKLKMGINRCIVYLQQTPRDSASGNVLHLLRLAMSIPPRV